MVLKLREVVYPILELREKKIDFGKNRER